MAVVGSLFRRRLNAKKVMTSGVKITTKKGLTDWKISVLNKLSGVLAKNWDKFENKANYFWLNFALLMFAFLIMMLLLKRLNRVFKETS